MAAPTENPPSASMNLGMLHPEALEALLAACLCYERQLASKPVVIALHCSASTGRQWRPLGEALGESYLVTAPDLFGCGTKGPWPGERPFQLADEAAPMIELIDAVKAPVHLVGHSYGATVALEVALARPSRVASLALYEPVAFHLLRSMGSDEQAALQEFCTLIEDIDRAVVTGAYRSAAQRFVDYWGGAGTWDALKHDARAEIVRYIPKACLDGRAALEARTPPVAYSQLRMPVLLMQGEHTTRAAALIIGRLAQLIESASWKVLARADHMGPITHADEVNAWVRDHIAKAGGPSEHETLAAAALARVAA